MIYLFRISFIRQLVVSFFLAAFGWEVLWAAEDARHMTVLGALVAGLLVLGSWWLSWRAFAAGCRVLGAHAGVTFGRR